MAPRNKTTVDGIRRRTVPSIWPACVHRKRGNVTLTSEPVTLKCHRSHVTWW